MRRFFTLLLITIFSLGMVMQEADARRFGGGRSFGRSYSRPSRSYSNTDPARNPAASPAGQPGRTGFNRGNRGIGPLGGMLGGLLAGGLIASLLMGGGLGAFQGLRIMDLLMIAGIGGMILLIVRSMRRSPAPTQYAGQYAGAGGPAMTYPPAYGSARDSGFSPIPDVHGGPASSGASLADERPAWFDEEAFLRQAKGTFIRLQAAHDAGDLADIRQYTTPEVFAEVSLQVQERGGETQHTELITLNAEVVDVFTDGDQAVASVRYSGLIREEASQASEQLNEIWHFQKPSNSPQAPWLITGIQQGG